MSTPTGDGRRTSSILPTGSPKPRLWAAAQLAFAYSVLRFAEAYGLWKERTWAEWLAFVSGTLFLPLEIHGLMRGITVLRSTVFRGQRWNRSVHVVFAAEERKRRRAVQSTAPESLDQSGK